MTEKSDLKVLFSAAVKQLEIVKALRPAAKPGSTMESVLEAALHSFDLIVVELLREHLSKVNVALDPKKGSWENRHAVLCVSYDGNSIRISVAALAKIDGEIIKKVRNKMNGIVFNNGQLRSVSDSTLPMTWAELNKDNSLRATLEREIKDMYLLPFGKERSFLQLMEEARLPLAEVVFKPDQLPANIGRAIQSAVEHFVIPEYHLYEWALEGRYHEALTSFVQQRRSQRVAVMVTLPKVDERWGRASYGIDVVSPDKRIFSICNSGLIINYPRYTFAGEEAVWGRYLPGESTGMGREQISEPEFVPHLCTRSRFAGWAQFTSIDVEFLPDDGKTSRRILYLPNAEWKVVGGTVSYITEHPATTPAKVEIVNK